MKVTINANEYVRVKLNDKGLQILREQHEDYCQRTGRHSDWKPPETDKDGLTKFHLWVLMQDFGPHIGLGLPMPFEPTISFEGEAR